MKKTKEKNRCRTWANWSKKTMMAAGVAALAMVFSCQSDEMTNGLKGENPITHENKSVQSTPDGEKNVVPDVQPQPEGGMKSFLSYFSDHFTYPDEAKKAGIQGKVYVQFNVNKNGTVSDVKVIRGIGGGCDEEAMKLISNGPRWIPGKKDGKTVTSQMVMPVTFKLE